MCYFIEITYDCIFEQSSVLIILINKPPIYLAYTMNEALKTTIIKIADDTKAKVHKGPSLYYVRVF